MQVNGRDGSFACSSRCWVCRNVFRVTSIGDLEVNTNEQKRGNLETDSSEKRAPSANEVDNEDREYQDGNKLNNGIDSGSKKTTLFTLYA